MAGDNNELLYDSAVNFIFAIGKFDAAYLKKAFELDDAKLKPLIDKMISEGAISVVDKEGYYSPLKTYRHSDYLHNRELKENNEKESQQKVRNYDKKTNKFLIIIAFVIFFVSCYFALREPISLVFITCCFVLIAYLFSWIGGKAQSNFRLSQSERDGTIRFCTIGFLIISTIFNVGFLLWVDSGSHIFGNAYSERKQYEERQAEYNKYEMEQEKQRVIRQYDAKKSVGNLLKDSSSAAFSDEKDGRDGAVCGYVNAKNSFGAYAGKTRYFSINGQAVIDDQGQSFEDLWIKYCD